MSAWDKQVTLLLRGHCLADAAQKALEGGDLVTGLRMMAEAMEAFEEARELAEKARNQ